MFGELPFGLVLLLVAASETFLLESEVAGAIARIEPLTARVRFEPFRAMVEETLPAFWCG